MSYGSESIDALNNKGYDQIIDKWCDEDYQGSGGVLAYSVEKGEYAMVTYTFGSCGGCDGWIDESYEKVVEMLEQDIEVLEATSLMRAKEIFNSRK
jgi:hypothetical protein